MDYHETRSAVDTNLVPNTELSDADNSGSCAGVESYDRAVSHHKRPAGPNNSEKGLQRIPFKRAEHYAIPCTPNGHNFAFSRENTSATLSFEINLESQMGKAMVRCISYLVSGMHALDTHCRPASRTARGGVKQAASCSPE
jgi:hypothetical protein